MGSCDTSTKTRQAAGRKTGKMWQLLCQLRPLGRILELLTGESVGSNLT